MAGLHVSLEEIRVRLHARGERLTRPRQAVLAAMAGEAGHLTAEQVVLAVAEQDPTVHRASVYRTLDALTQLGVVQHVHLGHGATVYHLVDDGQAHLHLHCLGCGSITDAPEDVLEGVAAHLLRSEQFELDLGHVALSGYCVACRSGSR